MLQTVGQGVNVSGTYYIAGGGGGSTGTGGTAGSGGSGGGGAGTSGIIVGTGNPGTANTGGGGGAKSDTPSATSTGGTGGSGIIIVRYPSSYIAPKIYSGTILNTGGYYYITLTATGRIIF